VIHTFSRTHPGPSTALRTGLPAARRKERLRMCINVKITLGIVSRQKRLFAYFSSNNSLHFSSISLRNSDEMPTFSGKCSFQ
jgi:hypothetical protein